MTRDDEFKAGDLSGRMPRERYRVAFEPGCGAGELSVGLAERCD